MFKKCMITLLTIFFAGKLYPLNTDIIEEKVFQLLNRERNSAGFGNFEYCLELEETARYHATNMINEKFFSHEDNEGLEVSGRVELLYPTLFGGFSENIALVHGDTEDEVALNLVTSWLNSASHYDNIMNEDYNYTGIAIEESGVDYYAVQNFGDLFAELVNITSSTTNARFDFRFLGRFPWQNLDLYIYFPDSTSVFYRYDGSYYTGLGCFPLDWNGDSFSVTLDLIYGEGDYILKMAKDNFIYPIEYIYSY